MTSAASLASGNPGCRNGRIAARTCSAEAENGNGSMIMQCADVACVAASARFLLAIVCRERAHRGRNNRAPFDISLDRSELRGTPAHELLRQQGITIAAHNAIRDSVLESAALALADHFVKAEPTDLYDGPTRVDGICEPLNL